METMTASEASARYPVAVTRSLRRSHAATLVAALYVALVLAAPAIVRFAPDLDARSLDAVTSGRPPIHCAAIASAPSPFQGFTVATPKSVAPTL